MQYLPSLNFCFSPSVDIFYNGTFTSNNSVIDLDSLPSPFKSSPLIALKRVLMMVLPSAEGVDKALLSFDSSFWLCLKLSFSSLRLMSKWNPILRSLSFLLAAF
jgi:hypothetical protein